MAEKEESTKTKTKSDKEVKVKEVESRSSKKGWLWALIGIVLAALAVVGFFFLKPKNALDDPKNSPTYSTSFFIYADGNYSLWNKDGKRLTEEVYSDKSNFIGGYAYVKKGSEYALIHESGKITVPFGQISRLIKSYAGLFLIEDNAGTRRLWTGNGKELLVGNDLNIEAPSSNATFLVAELDGNYYVYNYAGRLVTQFAKVNDDEVEYSTASDYAIVYYNGSNLFFDVRSGKQLALFENERYAIDDVTEDRGAILMKKYDDEEGGAYKLFIVGKDLYELTEIKYYGMVRNTNIIIGYDDSYEKIALLGNDYKIVKELSADVALKDINNYAVVNQDGKVEIYQNGNLVKTFDGESELASGVVYDVDLYAIKNNDKYGFYRLNGSLAFGEYKDIYSLFNKFHRASVSDDGENYYMIDDAGNRVNDLTYKRIYGYEHSYLIVNEEGKRAVLNELGQPMTGFDYTEGYNRSIAVDHEIWSLKREANKYDVLDVMTGKVILSNVNTYDFYANYFVIKNDNDKKEFYTYTGYKFYAEE